MMRKENTKEPLSKPVIVTSIILGLFTLFCIYLVISLKSTRLVVDIFGLIALIVFMNIASRLRITKEKVKFWSLVAIVMTIVAIPLMLNRIIFSLALSIPAFIVSKKIAKKNSKPTTVKIAYFSSLIVFLLGISLSIVSVIMNLVNNGL
ncbi:MAG: hypothetical protein IKD74_07700 [Clostridia bacterium]|nr:hypothetical protein [Clostridia bacterium]